MEVRVHVFISGRVQGVFFRSETEREARTHGVKGWIRNLPDGRVEAIFEGNTGNVNKLVEFCRRGPPAARVTKIVVVQEQYEGRFTDFRVM